jgi:2-keto-3-deoxy-6-phosphogluconate aldolase
LTELESATLRVIADSAESAAKLSVLGDGEGAKSALERAQHRLVEFSEGKPWHARAVRLAREAVARAELLVGSGTLSRKRQARSVQRAAARAKTL